MNITRKLEFDAAHRVMNHESKCASLHGHRYVVEVVAAAPELDKIGRVVDFSVLKSELGGWIDTYWDHTTILFEQDEKTINLVAQCPGFKGVAVVPFNPTAENMADYLLRQVFPPLVERHGIKIVSVTVWETPNCKATATL